MACTFGQAGVPAFGSWATPGTVGYLGLLSNLIEIDPTTGTGTSFQITGPNELGTTVTSTWTWNFSSGALSGGFPTTGSTGVEAARCNDDYPAIIDGYYIRGPLWYGGSGVLHIKNSVIDGSPISANISATQNTGYNSPNYNDGTVPPSVGIWTGGLKGWCINAPASNGTVIIENSTIKTGSPGFGTPPSQINNGPIFVVGGGYIQMSQCDISGIGQGSYPLTPPGSMKQCYIHGFHFDTGMGNPAHLDGCFIAGTGTGFCDVWQCYIDGPAGSSQVTASLFCQNTGENILIPQIRVYANYFNMTGGFGTGYCLRNQSGQQMDVQNNSFPIGAVATTEIQHSGYTRATYLSETMVSGIRTLGQGNLCRDNNYVPIVDVNNS